MKQTNFLSIYAPDNNSKKIVQTEPVHLFVDGASRGNPGPAGIGIFCKQGRTEIFKKGFFIGKHTNNFAEYSALVCGLQIVLDFFKKNHNTPHHLKIFSDSQLVVFQIKGLYKVKNPIIKQLFEKAQKLLSNFSWTITHILREKNQIADQLANQGLNGKSPPPKKLLQLIKTT